nr:MAG TPA: hypothetical protein [Caudoviricetes sp.]
MRGHHWRNHVTSCFADRPGESARHQRRRQRSGNERLASLEESCHFLLRGSSR